MSVYDLKEVIGLVVMPSTLTQQEFQIMLNFSYIQESSSFKL